MSLGTEEAHPGEIIASAPGDIQVIIYGKAFPAKKLKKDIAAMPRTDIRCMAHAG